MIKLKESRKLEDYERMIYCAYVHFVWDRGQQLPFYPGTPIFVYKDREYNLADLDAIYKEAQRIEII